MGCRLRVVGRGRLGVCPCRPKEERCVGFWIAALQRIGSGQLHDREGEFSAYFAPETARFPCRTPLSLCGFSLPFGGWGWGGGVSDRAEEGGGLDDIWKKALLQKGVRPMPPRFPLPFLLPLSPFLLSFFSF